MIFYTVVIDRVIAMIVGIRAPGLIAGVHAIPVVVPGCQPQRGYSQLLEIGKMIDDAAKVAPVISAWVAAVLRRRTRICGGVARLIAPPTTILERLIRYRNRGAN